MQCNFNIRFLSNSKYSTGPLKAGSDSVVNFLGLRFIKLHWLPLFFNSFKKNGQIFKGKYFSHLIFDNLDVWGKESVERIYK